MTMLLTRKHKRRGSLGEFNVESLHEDIRRAKQLKKLPKDSPPTSLDDNSRGTQIYRFEDIAIATLYHKDRDIPSMMR